MKKYFKIVGYISLILWLISFVALIVQYVKLAIPTTTEVHGFSTTTGGLDGVGHFYYIATILVNLAFGPSVALLFIYTGNNGRIFKKRNKVIKSKNEAIRTKNEKIKRKNEAIRSNGNGSSFIILKPSDIKYGPNYSKFGMNTTYNKNITSLLKNGNNVTFKVDHTSFQIEAENEEAASEIYNKIKQLLD